jgi:hypothetical protein
MTNCRYTKQRCSGTLCPFATYHSDTRRVTCIAGGVLPYKLVGTVVNVHKAKKGE